MQEEEYVQDPRIERVISNVIEYFNFKKVHRYMCDVQWEWRNKGVPSVATLKKEATRLLRDVAYGGYSQVSTGGFMAVAEGKDAIGELGLNLYFILTSSEANEMDDDY